MATNIISNSNISCLVTDNFAVRFKSNVFTVKNLPVPTVLSVRSALEPTNAYVTSNHNVNVASKSTEMDTKNKQITKSSRNREMLKNQSLVCATIMANSVNKIVSETLKAKELGADLVEIQLENFKNLNPLEDLKTIIHQSPLPTLFTFRPKWEGINYEGNEKERQDVLRLAMELGANYIDIDIKVASEFIKSIHGKKPRNCKVIVSSYNYENTPSLEELNDIVTRIQQTGADIAKIVTNGCDITDVARVFHITSNSQVPTIGLVMGERGLLSWLLCSKFGGYMTFATLESEKANSIGRPTINDLLNLYNFRQIGPETKVYGVMGNPISHSKSPFIHNQGFKSIGFNGVYIHLLVDNVASFFKTYSSLDFAGFSIAIPYKEAILECCDEVDPLAKSIGAANTIIKRQCDGKLVGYNTDCIGAISAIEDGLRSFRSDTSSSSSSSSSVSSSESPLDGKTVVIVGAGGAGRALAYGAKEKGANVVIANRTHERAIKLANSIGGKALSLAELDNFYPQNDMILVNTTSVGMQPNVNETPISKHALKHYALVFDAVYTPRTTRLLREAQESGAMVVFGSEMFFRQAFEQFQFFTGFPAPEELFRQIMSKY